MRTFGVEEEFLLVDGRSGEAVPAGAKLVARDTNLSSELQLEQIETCTKAHLSLSELEADIRRSRQRADNAASKSGARIAALATSPLPVKPSTTPGRRYEAIAGHLGITGREQLTNGCHVHVSIASEEEGVAVLDRIRIWLPVLAAMSANSPFWNGQDTGYAAFRSQAWGRWPATGPNEVFGSAAVYRRHVQSLLRTGVLLDEGMIYFDARLSSHHPTVEIRVADVCLHATDAVLLAALTRALVETAAREWEADQPPVQMPAAMLRMATWRASKWGLGGKLLHPLTGQVCGTAEIIAALHHHVQPALADAGDDDATRTLIEQLLTRGTGAHIQHNIYEETKQLSDVVATAISLTNG
jgi:carboxylate-amine ligase